MKSLTRTVVLCTLLLACSKEKDTNPPPEWGQAAWPRLSAGGTPVSSTPVSSSCEDMTQTHSSALQTLSSRLDCIDAVIAALDRFKETTPGAWSDLAAAYYVRAQRKDQPQDFLSALDAADDALLLRPQSPDALFNRALIEEALGLDHHAIASYDAFRTVEKTSPWSAAALARRNALTRKPDARRQWELTRPQLLAAARAGDRKKVAQWITPFVAATQRWLEQDLLRQWDLPAATVVAQEWSQVTGDPYMADVLRAIHNATPDQLSALKEGHTAFAAARNEDDALRWSAAGKLYAKADALFTRGGSPLRLGAIVGVANAASQSSAPASAIPSLDAIEPEARLRGYQYLLTRLHGTRGLLLALSSRHVEAIPAYEEAARIAAAIGDRAGVAAFLSAKADQLNLLGSRELAWRERFVAARSAAHIFLPRELNRFHRTAAQIASALEHPRIALRYYDAAIVPLRRQLRETPPEDATIRGPKLLLSRTLQFRAEPATALRMWAEAQRNHYDAKVLGSDVPLSEAQVQRALSVKNAEIEGRLRLARDDDRAAESFTTALEAARNEQTRDAIARLYLLRADAHRKMGRLPEAEQDVRSALAEIRAEEQLILEKRRRGEGEGIWRHYFQRYASIHQQLVRQLLDDNRSHEAYDVAEHALAVEPLDLLLDLPLVPQQFRDLVGDDRMAARKDLQAVLPEGTFLIQYAVFDDRSFAWVMSRDRFELVPLPARRADVRRWTEALRAAAKDANQSEFRRWLSAPYDGLVAEPVAAIAKRPHGNDPQRRFVFIPDEETHGLPFAALRDIRGRYVIQDATVAIAGSATLYAFSLLRDANLAARQTPPSILLLCYPEPQPALDLGPLPRAEEEVRAVAELYGATPLIGAAATPAALFAQAPASSIVHIAGHAVPNASQPSGSTIFLAPGGGDDGLVLASELTEKVRLDDTRLFVFSACSTAGGSAVGREGLAPLVRPVIGAGAPAVVGTLWIVRDTWAKQLLVAFHNHHRSGKDAAAALRAAQLELLNPSNGQRQPELAWGAYQAVGHAASPFASSSQTTRRNQP